MRRLYLVQMVGPGELFYKIGVTYHEDWLLRFTSHDGPGQTPLAQQEGLTPMERLRLAFGGHKFVPHYIPTAIAVHEFVLSGDAYEVEQDVFGVVYPRFGYVPKVRFDGFTECFDVDAKGLQAIRDYVASQASSRNADAVPADIYDRHWAAASARTELGRHRYALDRCRDAPAPLGGAETAAD